MDHQCHTPHVSPGRLGVTLLQERQVGGISLGEFLHRFRVVRLVVVVAADNVCHDKQHARFRETIILDVLGVLLVARLADHPELVEPQRLLVGKEQLSQVGQPLDRIIAIDNTIGPFVVPRGVDHWLGVLSKQIPNARGRRIRTRNPAALDVPDMHQKLKRLLLGLFHQLV